MAAQTTVALDATDYQVLRELQEHARLAYKELGRRVGLSASAVIERVRKLEDAGVITGYHAAVDPARLGLPIEAYIRMRCFGERCILRDMAAAQFPEVLEAHRVSGSDCALLRVRLTSVAHLQDLIDRLAQFGPSDTALVLSSPVSERVLRAAPGAG
ncbi:MAG TPA: Lrp/AsnC family transcriptional regulator [Herpetosiphonaceae bacterium]|nr:Lrp/AsnC family transcriptional regulator [Herpetosiphonaceae bacterium]